MGFQKNIVISFRKVKADIENLQHQISQLKEKVEDIDIILLEKEGKTAKKTAKTKKKKR